LDDDWLGVEWGLMETNRLQYQREKHPWKGRVPDETDLLVTHTPPVGSSALLCLLGKQSTDSLLTDSSATTSTSASAAPACSTKSGA
jgi:hypothetical protein